MQSMHYAHMDPSHDQEGNRWVRESQSCLMHASMAKKGKTRLLISWDSPRQWCSYETPQSWEEQTAQIHLVRRVSWLMEMDAERKLMGRMVKSV